MERENVTRTSNGQKGSSICAPPILPAAHSLLQSKPTIGNRMLGQMVQAKLKVSQSGDASELEADRMAETVMRMPDAHQGRAGCSGAVDLRPACVAASEHSAQGDMPTPRIPAQIQRQPNLCELPEESTASSEVSPAASEEEIEEVPIQRSADGKLHGSPNITERISASKGKGAPLPESTRNDLGGKMGTDFADVRIHTDSHAVQLSKDLAAHAFTHGADIYFNEGKYNPDSGEGNYLLAHELAHTLQQNNDASVVKRLAVTVQAPLAKGTCGQYSTRWIFALDNPAPEDGYIVQQIDEYKEVLRCPSLGRCLARPTQTFWEAWFVRRGDTHEHLHASLGFTDQDSQRAEPRKVGYNVGTGEIKFFRKSVTGDLGKDSAAPATPNGGWGPGNAPLSGSLPSTTAPPSWWSNAPTEGPANRLAYAAWRCCSDSRDFNVIKTNP